MVRMKRSRVQLDCTGIQTTEASLVSYGHLDNGLLPSHDGLLMGNAPIIQNNAG